MEHFMCTCGLTVSIYGLTVCVPIAAVMRPRYALLPSPHWVELRSRLLPDSQSGITSWKCRLRGRGVSRGGARGGTGPPQNMLCPPPPNCTDWSEYNICSAGAVRVHLKSHALPLMSYTNRQRSAAWRRTHPLTVWFAANYLPYTMPLD